MELKQEDRKLFRVFFSRNKSWIMGNSLNAERNLIELKRLFINYMEEEKQSENLSFMIFILMLDQEIIESKKQVLIKKYQNSIDGKIYLKSVFPPLTDNVKILAWINQSNIVHEVSRTDMERVGEKIHQVLKHENEEMTSLEAVNNNGITEKYFR